MLLLVWLAMSVRYVDSDENGIERFMRCTAKERKMLPVHQTCHANAGSSAFNQEYNHIRHINLIDSFIHRGAERERRDREEMKQSRDTAGSAKRKKSAKVYLYKIGGMHIQARLYSPCLLSRKPLQRKVVNSTLIRWPSILASLEQAQGHPQLPCVA